MYRIGECWAFPEDVLNPDARELGGRQNSLAIQCMVALFWKPASYCRVYLYVFLAAGAIKITKVQRVDFILPSLEMFTVFFATVGERIIQRM